MEATHAHTRFFPLYFIANMFDTKQNYRTVLSWVRAVRANVRVASIASVLSHHIDSSWLFRLSNFFGSELSNR